METTDTTPAPGDTVRVAGWSGIAFAVRGPTTEHRHAEDEWLLMCEDEGCDHDDEACYYLSVDEDGYDEETGELDVVMVGDDRVFHVDPEDCSPLDEDDYCGECGQIGCGHG